MYMYIHMYKYGVFGGTLITMWRKTSCNLLKQMLASPIFNGGATTIASVRSYLLRPFVFTFSSSYCSSSSNSSGTSGATTAAGENRGGEKNEGLTYAEAKKVMSLVNVEDLKKRLGMENKEVIGYGELVEACISIGVAKSAASPADFARILDEAGVVLLFRDKVYLHPDKVVDLVRKAVPLAFLPEDDPTKDELKELQAKMEEIDRLAHKHVRCILWTGLGAGVLQVGLFFRLTFWEFSWDVMEPIAFFTTTTGIVIGYAYFLITSRDPTYQDLMKRLFLSRQRKLIKKHNFDIQRFVELQNKSKLSLYPPSSTAKRNGIQVEAEEIMNGH